MASLHFSLAKTRPVSAMSAKRLAVLALLLVAPAAHADCGCAACFAVVDPVVDLEVARLEREAYYRYERPSRVRALRTEIALNEARVAALRRLMADYGRVTRFSTGNALAVTVENVRLELLHAEARREELRLRLLAEERLHRRMKLHHAAAVRHAANSLAEATAVAEPSIVIESH